MNALPLLELEGVSHRYGGPAAPVVLDRVSFTVGSGEFLSIVGPSGSGKTTLLRVVAGLTQPTAGQVRLAGKAVVDVPGELAIVFQDYGRSLVPWMTVRENVEMPLRRIGLGPVERRQRIESSLDEVGLSAAADRYPWQLSGGMQQRTAIARAIAYRPTLLLMDEPFASVDAQTRADLQDTMLEVWQHHGSTVLLVTHDIDESVYLADRVLVLSPAPAQVEAEVRVDLPRPRDQIETKQLQRFVDLRAEVARLILRPAAGLRQDEARPVADAQRGLTTSDATSSPSSAMPNSTMES